VAREYEVILCRGAQIVKLCLGQQKCRYQLTKITNSMEQSPSLEVTFGQSVKKLLAFYGTRWFITVCTTAHLFSLPSVVRTHSKPCHRISLTSVIILFSHLQLGLASSSFLKVFQLNPYTTFSTSQCVLRGEHKMHTEF